ncbi:MAG: DUF547 domain-containing protein [Myxococcota bacterium]
MAAALLALTAPAQAQSAVDLALYARLLETHTRATTSLAGTEVDYAPLVHSRALDRLVAQLEASKPAQLDRPGQLAFWINAYNLLTLDLVRKHHPIASIRDVGSFFSPVWKRPVATIDGRRLSLDAIEHEILRPMGEPRIHAAIVCASKSCPPLRRTPFRPETLDADLDDAVRRFLASPAKGVAIDRTARTIRVSKIFEWFEEDFEAAGGVRAFLAAHLPPPDAAWLRGPGRDAMLLYFDYDWSLNGR